jgi:cell division protease FtsH
VKLITTAHQSAQDVLNDNLDILHQLAELLLEKETVMGKELDELIHELRPGITLPSKSLEEPEPKAEATSGQA